MQRKRVALESLGCKLNYAETIQIEKEFLRRGFEVVPSSSAQADVFVINTCTVTQSADSDCRQIVRRALRSSPDAFVVVTGCYAQGKPEEVAQIEGVDLVLGAKEKFELFNYIDDFTKNYHARIFVGPIEDAVEFGAADSALRAEPPVSPGTGAEDPPSAAIQTRTRAFLKVQDGCDYKCSYCTIPKVRGPSRSPSISFLVNQAKEIAARGFKEIVLSGVNVGDFNPKPEIASSAAQNGESRDGAFIDLIQALDRVEGIERIRISSIEPNLLTDEIIRFVSVSSKMCKHFHIPMQSGSDFVLKRMRRRYNTSQYRAVVERIKEFIPEAGIGADVIVGFPGETNEDFERTYLFIESLPLTYLHVFTYSEREGTDAANFGDKVDPRVKRKRSEILRMLSVRKRYEFNRKHIGKIVTVLVEEEMKNGKMFGFTSNYVRVELDAIPSRANEMTDVLITGVSDNTAIGQIIPSFQRAQ
jgi:threonylcarbamoyladenosine tRNA methylthiotransferase MtaB